MNLHRRSPLLTLALLSAAMLAPNAAGASAGVTIAPSFPSPVTVGATNLPASLLITNDSTAPDNSLTLCNVGDAGLCTGSEGITLLASCGGQDFTLACNAFDPGVFSIDTPAVGAAGSACQGTQFTVAVASVPTGKVRFTPTAGQVVLPARGSSCRIDFTVDVLSLPDIDRRTTTPGLQTVQIAETFGVSDQSLEAFARGQSTGATVMAAPAMTSSASPGVAIGGAVTDSASLRDEFNPASGSVTFQLYGADDTTCSSAPMFSSTVPVAADGTATSGAATPATAGTYRWIASYGGDASNNPAAGSCADAGESVAIAKASPSIATIASPSVTIGGQATDSVTLLAEHNPAGGNVTFRLYGAGDATCSDTPVFSSTVPLRADGTATSGASTPQLSGTYRWIAAYAGDANNAPATGACNDQDEAVVIAKASPAMATAASPGVTIGGQVTDAATLAGEHNPAGGTVTFRLYEPGDAGCSGAPVFSSTIPIDPDGTATSMTFSPGATGTHRWIASYSGDASNAPASGSCNDPGEQVVVAKATPAIATVASPGVPIGGQVTASAALTGEHDPTGGSVTFRLYAPLDTTCTGTPAFTSPIAIGSGGTASSGAFTPPAPGTYRWTASYGGDASNNAASTTCGDAVTVTKATPSIQTNASAAVAIEGQITDSATLVGEFGPTSGSVTFRLYGPADVICAEAAVFTSAVPIGEDGTVTSQSFTVPAPGTYRWVASYGGDANNDGASGACDDPGESVSVAKRSPSITANASPGVTIGGQVTASATLVGERNPAAGSMTFGAYGPGDSTCSGAAAFSVTIAIGSDGTADSAPFTPATAGTYRWIASYGGDANNAPATGACNDVGTTVVIAKAQPAIATTGSAGVMIGGRVTDSATLSGEHNPVGGDVTFRLYGPADATCMGAVVFTTTAAIDPDGTVTSSGVTPLAVGTYRWIASYSGDANNEATSGGCNDPGETVVVAKRSPTLSTSASASVAVGGTITDRATLTGELYPTTGDVTFRLYGPGDQTCAGTPLRSSTVAILADGTATSPGYVTSMPGTYRWIAGYGGDANHLANAGACNDPDEAVTVTKASPSIVTNASAAVAVGGRITDSATLVGEFGPATGDVTFRLYGAQDATCSASAIFQSVVTISGDGTATSQAFSPPSPGTYRWVASYSGDAHSAAAVGACNDPGESVTVTKAAPSMTTNASPAVAVGGRIADTATLVGEAGPTSGNVTFRLYGSGDPACSGAAVFSSTVAIGADASATSAAFVTTSSGTYRWIATYDGDDNNAPARGVCSDPEELVIVGIASPLIVTAASASVPVGGTVSDSAMLVGEAPPTRGNVKFSLYGPGNGSCTGTPLFESTVAINTDGTAKSAAFEPKA
ncbi:MAG: hypothetical protein QOJ89_3770, partial [bacterium]